MQDKIRVDNFEVRLLDELKYINSDLHCDKSGASFILPSMGGFKYRVTPTTGCTNSSETPPGSAGFELMYRHSGTRCQVPTEWGKRRWSGSFTPKCYVSFFNQGGSEGNWHEAILLDDDVVADNVWLTEKQIQPTLRDPAQEHVVFKDSKVYGDEFWAGFHANLGATEDGEAVIIAARNLQKLRQGSDRTCPTMMNNPKTQVEIMMKARVDRYQMRVWARGGTYDRPADAPKHLYGELPSHTGEPRVSIWAEMDTKVRAKAYCAPMILKPDETMGNVYGVHFKALQQKDIKTVAISIQG